MIVDTHTHWGIVWEARDQGDPARWIAGLDEHGVDKTFLMPHAGLFDSAVCRRDNELVTAVAATSPDRLIPIGTAWPQQGAAAVDEMHYCIETLGMKGMKFHPWVQGFSTAIPTFGELCALAGEMGVPVFFHDGSPCYCLSEQIGGLARRFPETQFVLGHSGLLWNWRSAIEAARQPNVWACMCGPHLRAIETFCRRVDPDRILWGTDYGFGFASPIGYRLGLMRQARITDDLRERILGTNPMRLIAGA